MTATLSAVVGSSAHRARHLVLLGVLAAASITGENASAQPNVDGSWSPLGSWPLVAVHAIMTPDGRVLTYGTKGDGTQTAYFIYDVWDPSAGLSGGHLTLNNLTQVDIFCSSQIIMPQNGDILIVGGDNWTGSSTTNTPNKDVTIFNPASNTLTRAAEMFHSRWYSSSTVLVNGDIYIQGGNGGQHPEVREQNGNLRLLDDVDNSNLEATFPHNFLAPDGRIFGYDANGLMYYVAPAGLGSISAQGQFASANAGSGSSAAMFAPGRILQFGGNSSGAIVIDINGPQPVITPTQSMSSQRYWVTGTVLPNGTVLATGGSRVDNQLDGVNNTAEVWNPSTGTWHAGSQGAVARLYHSNALLLQDGTVLVAGGGAQGPLTNLNAEIYSPPYLFNSSGGAATRPQIVNAPSSADVGATLSIEANTTDVSRITLVKTGSTTHSVNMDQRFVELPFTRSSTVVTATLPPRASDTPPGFYHLFLLNSAGVPSRSKLLQINIDTTPNTAVDFTPTIGGSSGTAYQLSCNVDEALVGVYGSYQTVINQIGPQCVRVDQFGRWIGNPAQRPLTGTTTTGTAFDKLCPRDFAMSGFRGQSATSVNQLELQCRALTRFGGLTGTGTFLGADGGTGGTTQPLQACGTENPVYALYGRSGTQINSFGVLCRTAVITPISTNSTPVIVNPGAQTSVTGLAVDLAIQASDGDNDPLAFTASGLPPGLSINPITGHITGVPMTPGATQAVVTVDDGTQTVFTVFNWAVTGDPLLTVAPMPLQPPRLAGTPVTYTATASGGTNVRYKWSFDDGTPETPDSSSPSVTHTFVLPGVYFPTLTVNDDLGSPSIQSFTQHIHLPLTPTPPGSSANIAYETRSGASSRVWLVNQDNDTVTVFDAVTNAKLAEIAVGAAPRSIAVAPDGRVWVVNRDGASISIVSQSSLAVAQTITLPRATQPFGLVFSSAANQAFVALSAAGRLLKLDASTGAQLASLDVGPEPRHLAIDGTSTRVYVSRFITPRQPGEETGLVASQAGTGGEVVVVDAANMLVTGVVTLRFSDRVDSENQGGGVPNYLGASVISPDGTIAIVPSKQDNIARGMLRNGQNLNFQSTVRAITSRINLTTGAEDYARRIDHDNASVASAVAYDPYGIYLFVALETSREVAVVDVHDGVEIFRFAAGRTPQGLTVSPNGDRLYVNNFMDRTVGVFDLSDLKNKGQWNVPPIGVLSSVGLERLPPPVLAGKQLFYDAKDPRLARDAYLSCASCHNDGGQDGRVWDLTGMGEGLRNTINLRGTGAKHGRLHWTGNFDEVQDFEGQIRTLAGGTGLMTDAAFNTGTRNQPLGDTKAGFSTDLDALAAYVASLSAFAPSPYRTSTGTLTPDAVAGRTLFNASGCASCHSGTAFTNSATNALENVGTIKPSSGQRLGAPLTGLDTPTLCSVWQSAPYLHDGSATSLAGAISAHSGATFSAGDLAQLTAFVQQIDAVTAPDCSTALPGLVAAYSFDEGSGTTVLDRAGGTNTGTIQGTVAWTTQGKNGGALVFNGTNNKVSVASSPSLSVTTGLTLEAWVYPTASQSGWRAIVQKQTDAWLLHASHDGGALRPAAGGTYGSTGAFTGSSTAIPVNTWSHLAQTYDGSTLRLYVNGTQVASKTQTGALQTTTSPMWIGGNTPYGEYFQGRIDDVRVYNRALSVGELTSDMNTPVGGSSAADTTLPSAPGTLTASAASATQINLTWGAATDNVGVTGYRVERCSGAACTTFTQIATPSGTSFSDTGLSASTSYSYRVRAVDAATNLGPFSNTSSATTQAASDTTPPSAPGTLTASAASATQINLSWGAATDNVAVTSYRVERCAGAGCTTFAQIATPSGTLFSDTGLTASTSYSYRVRAVDAAANPGPFSNTSTATTQAAPDTTPPSAPGTLTATAASPTQVNLSWGASTDNVGVTGYRVERCLGAGCNSFTQIATPTANSFSDTGLTASTLYRYRVRAVDAAVNLGPFSNTSNATTQAAPDTTPPSAPGTLTASATSATQINLSWGAATDNVGVTGYRVERCSGAGCTSFTQVATPTGTSLNNTGLTASTSYSYRVLAADAAGNPGPYSNTSSATTPAAPDTTPPSAPGALTASAASATQIDLTWGAATDNVGVTSYRVERCAGAGCTSFTQIATPSGTIFSDTGRTASTSYSYRVRAVDAAANLGPFSNTSTATTQAAPDTTPPSAPGPLTASAASVSQINLSWGVATDNVGVTGYRVERCSGAGCTTFTQIATPTGTSFNDTGLTASTSYNYRVLAVDAAANPGPFSNTSSATTPAQTAIPGLVAAYAFDEGAGTTVLDRAGNTNTGTIQGTVAWTTQGKNAGALVFNGTNTKVSVASAPSLNLTTGVTLEAWVYPTASQSGWRAVVQKQTDAWLLHASHDGGALRPAAGGTFGSTGAITGSSTAIPINTWSHLAQTYDGSTLRLYVNGVQVASRAQTGALQTTTSPMWIGGNTPYGEYFQGRIDDVRVYNRALSVSELASDMSTPVGP